MDLYAVYATCQTRVNRRTFRIGSPVPMGHAYARHGRLDRMHYNNKRRLGVFAAGRKTPYIVAFLEVRQVDALGRGLGSERHATATPVLTGAIRCLPDAQHTIDLYRNRAWRATDQWGATVKSDEGVIIGYGKSPIAAAANARREARIASVI